MVMPYTYDGLRREVEGELRRHLAEARDEVPAAVQVQTVLLRGKPARELARYAESGRFDLLVTGPRPCGRLKRLLSRSVTHALLTRSRVSVLAVKPS
jgi:nucleotide-binding universal stress UspA family protein